MDHKDVTYQVENIDATWEELAVHLNQHDVEAAVKKQPIKLDYARYTAVNSMGNLYFLTARHNGELIGYLTAFLSTHLQYRDIKIVAFDTYYVTQKYRRYLIALQLFREAEKRLTLLGFNEMVATSKMRYDAIFIKLGWVKTDHVFTKELSCVTP